MSENQDQNKEAQRNSGDEALESNTGAGGSQQTEEVNLGQDSDGNSGIMTNDEFEKEDVGAGGPSLRDPADSGESEGAKES